MSDILILGGGSAGCVLASRLSENPQLDVTLVEAGADILADDIPEDVASGYPGRAFLNRNHLWPELVAKMGGLSGNAARTRMPRRYEQARVLGGGSSINAMVANRGSPQDYDAWTEEGADGWSWDTVLPYFRKLERDCDFDGPYHGKDGPIPIRRHSVGARSGFVRAACDTLLAQGRVARDDQNGAWEDGVFPVTVASSQSGHRVPVPLAYLPQDVRARPNLRILTNASVRRILFDGGRATGAEVVVQGRVETLRAAETIVSCGSLHTPSLLMRSGVGPQAELAGHGIGVIAARAGVGRNLMEHPSMALAAYLQPHARLKSSESHHIEACLRFSSGLETCPPGDLHMAIVAKSAWHGVGRRLGNLFVWVNKPYSRGEVTLNSADPASEPNVDFRLLSDARDRQRLAYGLRVAADVLSDPSMATVAAHAFPAAFSDRVRRVSVPSAFNALQTAIFGHALDWAFGLRGQLIRDVISRGITLRSLLADEQAMDAFLNEAVGGTWHASGTCRMGRRDDPMAVTDSEGRVYGVGNLRVCDASLMPSIPCANTNTPTIMMAERISDLIKASR
jgi:5-(hydroxymethyl)furfural/furfural oxidase